MACTFTSRVLFIFSIFLILSTFAKTDKKENNDKDKWKKKDIRDYNDADIERLYDEWEDGDEDELEEDELPEWKKEPPKIDMSNLDMSDPEGMLKHTKKGRTLMMFATVSGNPTQAETEKITQMWQGSLFNANINVQRYIVSENRAIFMLTDGSMAWEIKDFLTQQERCEEVTIENKSYPGKGASGAKKEDKKTKDGEKKKKDKKTTQKDKKDGEDKKDSKDKLTEERKKQKEKLKDRKDNEIIDNETTKKDSNIRKWMTDLDHGEAVLVGSKNHGKSIMGFIVDK